MAGKPTKNIFVLMPFHEDFGDVYMAVKFAADQAAKELPFEIHCFRADDSLAPGLITNHIIDSIKQADLLIADISPTDEHSGANPNVMYELGFGHALGKQAIIINQNVTKTPFDTTMYRQVQYDRKHLKKDCGDAVAESVKAYFGRPAAADAGTHRKVAEERKAETKEEAPRTQKTVRPGSQLVAELQGFHLQLQMARAQGDLKEARDIAKKVSEKLSMISVVSGADSADENNTAAAAGNCAVELEKVELGEEAEQIYKKTIGLFPNYAGVHIQYADFLVDSGRPSEAKEQLDRARKLDGDDRRIKHVEMKLSFRTGEVNTALGEQLRAAFEANPSSDEAAASYLVYLDKSNASLDEFERVCKAWEEALGDDRKWVAQRALADQLASSNASTRQHKERAIEIYERQLQHKGLGNEAKHAVLHNVATLYAGMDKKEEAIARWRLAYKIKPDDPAVKASFSQRLAAWDKMDLAVRVVKGLPLESDEAPPPEA